MDINVFALRNPTPGHAARNVSVLGSHPSIIYGVCGARAGRAATPRRQA